MNGLKSVLAIFSLFLILLHGWRSPLSFNKIIYRKSSREPQRTLSTFRSSNLRLYSSKSLRNPAEIPVRIANDKLIYEGDYVVHDSYGIGRFIGRKYIRNQEFGRGAPELRALYILQFADTEIYVDESLVQQKIFFFSPSTDPSVELDSALSTKWQTKKAHFKAQSKKVAANLINTIAIRNNQFRPPCLPDGPAYKSFEKSFKFTPTVDQQRCFEEISFDMINSTRPMNRLVCGDVGFGKTEVATRAACRAVLSYKQVAYLAPTRVLAMQIAKNLQARMPNINVQFYPGMEDKKTCERIKRELQSGSCQVIVGTTGILHSSIRFMNLGLIIIDEEHRFGVLQKEKLKTYSSGIDVLTLTATPIPRTLDLAVKGLFQLSHLFTPPAGRKEVQVFVERLAESHHLMKSAIENELSRGGQAFVIVPYVSNITETQSFLQTLCPQVRVLIVHGGLPDIEERITKFQNKEYDVLLATIVVESGIDIPNVNTLIVIAPERFGLATLYQLRGRVGRSDRQAYAYFFFRSDELSESSIKRLQVIKSVTALGAGSRIAEEDRLLRGEGNLFGIEQSGRSHNFGDYGLKMLEDVLSSIRQVIFNGVSETFITLNDEVEKYGTKMNIPIPESNTLNSYSRWENQISAIILRENVITLSPLLNASDQSNKPDTTKTTRKNGRKKKTDLDLNSTKPIESTHQSLQHHTENDFVVNQFIHEFSCTFDLTPLFQILQQYNQSVQIKPNPLTDALLLRKRIRIATRKLGIERLLKFEGQFIYIWEFESLNEEKWNSVMEKLPQNYSRLLKYDCSAVHFHPDKDDHYPLETMKNILETLVAINEELIQGLMKEIENEESKKKQRSKLSKGKRNKNNRDEDDENDDDDSTKDPDHDDFDAFDEAEMKFRKLKPVR